MISAIIIVPVVRRPGQLHSGPNTADTCSGRRDVQMVGGPEACQCRTGYYSANYDGTSDYKQKLPGGLDCQPSPAGFSCRFRADTVDPQYNTACAVNQQKCPCPVSYYCPATVGTNIAVPIQCDTGGVRGARRRAPGARTAIKKGRPRVFNASSADR
jgi:hypothetical protein